MKNYKFATNEDFKNNVNGVDVVNFIKLVNKNVESSLETIRQKRAKESARNGETIVVNENNSPPKGDFTKSMSPNKGELQSTKKINSPRKEESNANSAQEGEKSLLNDESKSNRATDERHKIVDNTMSFSGTENNYPPKGDFTQSKSPNKGELQSSLNYGSISNRATDLGKNIVEMIMSPQKDNSIETTHNISPLKNNTLIIQHQNRNDIEDLDESEPVVQSLSGKLEKASGKSNNNKSGNNKTMSASEINVGGELSTYSAADTNYTSIVDPNDHGKGNCIDGVLIVIGSHVFKYGTFKIVSGENDPHVLID